MSVAYWSSIYLRKLNMIFRLRNHSRFFFTSMSSFRDCIRPRRAILYVPGHDKRKIDKLRLLNVDCAVLDCEDGVALSKKSEARQVISDVAVNYDFGKTEFAVRINSIESGLAEEDLSSIFKCKVKPETLMVPKVESVEHVGWIHNALLYQAHFFTANKLMRLVFFIESAKSMLDLRSICQKSKELFSSGPFIFEGLVFGSDDFCADIGATRTTDAMELLTARQMFVMTAKSFRLQAIDMVHINYKDSEGLKRISENGARMGFTGKQVIHPDQVATVQEAFSPSAAKIKWAKELIELYEKHQKEGKGAFTYMGDMIDRPLLLQAECIVKIAESLN